MPTADDPRITVRLPQRLYDELERRGRPSTVARDLIELGVGRIEYAPDYDSKPERKQPLAGEVDGRQYRCSLPVCRHQQKGPGRCPVHRAHDLVPVRL